MQPGMASTLLAQRPDWLGEPDKRPPTMPTGEEYAPLNAHVRDPGGHQERRLRGPLAVRGRRARSPDRCGTLHPRGQRPPGCGGTAGQNREGLAEARKACATWLDERKEEEREG